LYLESLQAIATSLLKDHPLQILSQNSFFRVLNTTETPKLAIVTKYRGLFLNSQTFFLNSKKLGKAYNSHKHLVHEFQIISSQNTKVMAKKLINMQHVIENSTSVSYNDPNIVFIFLTFQKIIKLVIWNYKIQVMDSKVEGYIATFEIRSVNFNDL